MVTVWWSMLITRDRPPLVGSFHALAADDGGGTAERDLGGVQVDGVPAQVEQLAAAGAGVGGEPVEGVQAVRAGGGQEGMQLPGGPDAGWFGAVVTRLFGSFGRIDGKQLVDVNGIG